MAPFLSTHWIAQLDEAARRRGPLRGLSAGQRLVVQAEVTDAPDGAVAYQMVFSPDGARVMAGAPERADLVVSTDYATAAALAQAQTNAQHALMGGRLSLRGEVEQVGAAREMLVELSDLYAAVRETTEF